MKKILITGISGQCGSMLCRHLLKHGGYEIYGMMRRTSNVNTDRIVDILDKVTILYGDLADQVSLQNVVKESNPDTVVNLAAQSFVHVSWTMPLLTADITGLGALRLIEAVRLLKPTARFIQASSSEMMGGMKENETLNEDSLLCPRSPYGYSKILAHHAVLNARESYGLWACCPIFFNYESEFRSPSFVTMKIVQAAVKIKMGRQNELRLGNLNSKRDWMYCGDCVEALRLIMESEKAEEYVIASGENHSVREFCKATFDYLDMDYEKYLVIDKSLFRPLELPCLLGDSSKIKTKLGWCQKTNFAKLIQIMVNSVMDKYKKGINF